MFHTQQYCIMKWVLSLCKSEMNALNFTSEELKHSILVALAHRSMRIIGTFICYFEDGHLLNRKKDIDKFLNRIVYSLDELNYSQQSKLIKRLL